ncbi:glycosyltransferase [Mucilaginibacter limnophilus]|uniref:Glycosyltransferase n=1 Tax=Mucilaginibacter limnophilus TaxID=1932778 RepID=A0A3S3TJH0_9SPHI|nr:glycosyltransferase family 4 protein [Mucilaginibacter limnophilus]RVU02467.1 glycosyltransferase [Mucilaginibacter limnophilus]
MRILLVNTFYYPRFTGGAEVSVQQLAEGLVNTGHEVFVLTSAKKDRVYAVNNVTVIGCRQRNVFSTYDNTSNKPAFLKVLWHLVDSANVLQYFKFKRILKDIKPDIVHTNNIQGFSPLIWFAAKKHKIKLLHTMRDYYLLCHKCNLFSKSTNCEKLCGACKITHNIKSRFAGYPDGYVGISNHILQAHQKFLALHNTHVIFNSAQLALIPVSGSATGVITFGYIGRITPDKGVEYLVDELVKINPAQRASFKIIFAGKGEPEFIGRLKSKLGSIDYEFSGIVNSVDFYKSIDVLIVPALWNEPFGRTVIESLAYSVPVCQSDRGGLKEIFDKNSSWMFSPDEGVLSVLLSRILRNRKEIDEKKRKCAKHLAHFSPKTYINRHLELYGQLIEASACKAGEVPALHNEVVT